MKTHHIVLFDLDGTLADYDGQMRRDLRRLQRPGEAEHPLHDISSPNHIDARIELIKAQTGWWLNLPRLSYGFDILRVAQELGFQVKGANGVGPS